MQLTDYHYEDGKYDQIADYFHGKHYMVEKEIFEFLIKHVEDNYDLKYSFIRYIYKKYRFEVDVKELQRLICLDPILYSLLVDRLLMAEDRDSESLYDDVVKKDE